MRKASSFCIFCAIIFFMTPFIGLTSENSNKGWMIGIPFAAAAAVIEIMIFIKKKKS